MADKKELIYGVIFVAVAILFMWLVMAVIDSNPSVRVISPANYTNNSGTITFNVTFLNTSGGGIVNPKNVTFYYNFSVNWAPISNSSGFVLNGSCFNSSGSCFVTIVKGAPGYNLSDGTYTINASIDNGTDQTSVSLPNNLSVNVIIDNTPPIVFNGNITNPVTENNYSGNLLLNVSVVDALATVMAVVFNITNATSDQTNGTGQQNATRVATQIGVIFFNYTINTAGFPDGLYNISILANDTTNGGNVNNTARVQLIRFDNTPPIVFNGNITNPVTENNYSGNLLLNVSVVDALATVMAVVFNITNATSDQTNGTGQQNATRVATQIGVIFFNYTINTAGFPDGLYNISILANDTTNGGNVNNTARVQLIRFDNTPPRVFNQNISNPAAGTNKSGTITFNVSLLDALSGVRTVLFNITNGTGTQNSTYTATREGTTTQYSVSVATTGFKDGNYTVTIFGNDTAGNLNNSARSVDVKFDNTAPAVTVSCTPSPVVSGNAITCTCTRSDATSGVNTVNFDANNANPSTSSTGTFTSSCTVTDFAGNSATGSTTYIVESSGSGSSSGSSGGGGSTTTTEGETIYWTTYSLNEEAFEAGHTRELKENQRLKVDIGTSAGVIEQHFVGIIDVTAKNAVIEVSSTPQRVTMNAGETKQFEVNGDNFYDISVTLSSISLGKAKINILSIHEPVPLSEPAPVEEEEAPQVAAAPPVEESAGGLSAAMTVILIIIIIVIVAVVAWFMMKKK